MAKKKARKAAPAKGGNALWWIVAIVVIVLIAWLVMKPAKVEAPTKSAEQPVAAEKGTLATSTAPAMDKKCTLAIGVVPGSKIVQGNNVQITFKNNGRVPMEGSYFEFSDGAGKVVYKKNADTVAPGATIQYKVDLAQAGSEVGIAIKSYVIYPIQGGKACENQRNVVIDYT